MKLNNLFSTIVFKVSILLNNYVYPMSSDEENMAIILY